LLSPFSLRNASLLLVLKTWAHKFCTRFLRSPDKKWKLWMN
jgi:hypothetical protein